MTSAIGLALAGCVLAFSVIDARTTQPPGQTQPQVAVSAPAVNSEDITAALALLDRIDRIVTNARKDVDVNKLTPVGTSGSAGASVMVKVDAADLDEIHAEVEQLKRLLAK
jgi:hypothetical protein